MQLSCALFSFKMLAVPRLQDASMDALNVNWDPLFEVAGQVPTSSEVYNFTFVTIKIVYLKSLENAKYRWPFPSP